MVLVQDSHRSPDGGQISPTLTRLAVSAVPAGADCHNLERHVCPSPEHPGAGRRPRILERRLRRAAETFTVCANEGCAARGRAVVRTNKGPSCFPAWRARSKKGLLL